MSTSIVWRLLWTCALPWAGAACSPPPPAPFAVAVRVESDPGRLLAGAQLVRSGKVLATSDAKGPVELSLEGSAGEAVELETRCPAGHRSPEKPLSISLRSLAQAGRRPEYHVSCLPLVRSLVVSVRAQQGPGLPVKYLGKEIARTDAQGAAHALLKVTPGDTVSVTLDTSAPEHAGLMPQNPELKLTVPERDEVVLFDQTFSQKPENKKRPRSKSGDRPVQMPRRL